MAALRLALLLALSLGAAGGALAEQRWVADGRDGQLLFHATQAGGRFQGAFRDFSVRYDHDPATSVPLRLETRVRLASVDTADAERDGVLRGAEFFWVERLPEARYVAERFSREGARWRAHGELTLRGVTRPVELLFGFEAGDGAARMQGGTTLRRLQFGVGQGEWASTEWVGDAVEVGFELRLRAAAPGTSR